MEKTIATKAGEPTKHIKFTAAEVTAREAEELVWANDTIPRNARAEISRLEQLITPSRLAEAVLGDTEWLQSNRELIAAQRLLL